MNSFSLRAKFKRVTLIPISEIGKLRPEEIKYLSQVIEPGSIGARIQTEAVYPQRLNSQTLCAAQYMLTVSKVMTASSFFS